MLRTLKDPLPVAYAGLTRGDTRRDFDHNRGRVGIRPCPYAEFHYLLTSNEVLFATFSAFFIIKGSGTLSRVSPETRPSVQTVSYVCLKRTCSLDTSAFSALEVLDDNRAP